MTYMIVVERTETGWSAYAPDLPGCVAAAATRAEVEALMREAVALHVEAMREDGEPVPIPQTYATTVEVAA